MSALKRLELVLRSALILQLLLPAPVTRADTVDTSTHTKDRGIVPTPGVGSAVIPADPFTGAARYTIPIEVPPGTGGLAPSIALSYSSSGPLDSWVGSRWSLSVPSISRSLKSGTPTYVDAQDTFELNGQELVALGGGQYATRRESFTRITHVTAPSDYWTIEHPDGTIQRFGTNSNSQITNSGGAIFEWLITEHEDLRGNGMTYSYDRTDPGQAYPFEIRYGLRRSGGVLTGTVFRTVRFVLEARNDTPLSHKAGFPRQLSKRLHHVDVLAHTSLVRSYSLRYDDSFDSFRSLLSGVDEYGSDAASDPTPPLETGFEYTSNYDSSGSPLAGATGWSDPVAWNWPASLAFVASNQQDNGTRLGDVNGDALPDLVKSYAQSVDLSQQTAALSSDSGVYLNTGSGFSAQDPTWVIPSEPTGQTLHRLIFAANINSVQRGMGRVLLDLTGDGRVDAPIALDIRNPILGIFNWLGVTPWFENSATGWIARDPLWAQGNAGYNSFARLSDGAPSVPITLGGNASFAELNGDGLPDLVVQGLEVAGSSAGCAPWSRALSYVAINRGGFDFEHPPRTAFPGTSFLAGSGPPFATPCSGTLYRTPGFYEACNPTDPACQRATFFTSTYNYVTETREHYELGNVYADVNADGLDDLITSYQDPAAGLQRSAQINLGTRAFTAISDAWALPAEALFKEITPDSGSVDRGTRLVDVNGDGRLDVLKARQGETRRLWLNDGDVGQAGDATPWREITSGWDLPLDVVDASNGDLGVRFADIDGDGMTDILRGHGSTTEVRLNLGNPPDLLKKITVPFGGTIEFGYQPSTKFFANAAGAPQYLPQVMQLVTSITVTPGHPQSEAGTTTLAYEGGLFDPVEREFRGFRKVTETRDPDGRIRTTLYHQQEIAWAGLVESVEVTKWIDPTKRWERSEYFYTPDETAPFASLLCKARRFEYDQQVTPRVSATLYEYDGQSTTSTPDGSPCSAMTPTVGNLTAKIEYGEVNEVNGSDVVGGDTRRSEWVYWPPPNPETYLVDRVGLSRLREGPAAGGPVMRESRFFYDDTEGIGTPPAPLTGALPSVGNLTKRVDLALDAGAVDPVTRFAYDPYGNVNALKRPRWDAVDGVTTWTTFTYDSTFHTFLTSVTNEKGQTTNLEWSEAGCRIAAPLGSGLVSRIRDPNAVAAGDAGEIRCYDAFGRLESLQAPGGLADVSWTYVDTPGSATITQKVWASGSGETPPTRDRVTFLDGLGRVVAVHEDGPSAKQVRTLISYDAAGRVVQQTGPQFSDAALDQTTVWVYDVLDRVWRTCLPGTVGCGSGTGRVQDTTSIKGVVKTTDASGTVTWTTRDPFGRVVSVQEGVSGPVTTYAWDVADQLDTVTDSAGNETRIGFDGIGRKIRLDDPDAGVSEYSYDANGNLRFLEIPSDVPGTPTVVEWEYDALDRPFRRRINGGSQVNWGYDGATNGIGRLSMHRTASFEHVPKEYDLLGRPTWERFFSPIAVPGHNLYTIYDPLGQMEQRTYPGAGVVQWTHDAKGYLTQIGTAQGDYATGIQWDALGRLQEWTAGNGFRTVRTYEPDTARLDAVEIRDAAPQIVRRLDYTFDNSDRLTGIAITPTTPVNLSLSSITYEKNRLKTVTGPFGPDRQQIPIFNSYDALGNLTCRESTLPSECLNGTVLQYPTTPGSPRPHAPTHVDGEAVLYDAMGNLKKIGDDTQEYTYTPLGELSSAWIAGALKASFAYDGHGRLVSLTNDLGQLLHLLTPDFEWNQTADLGRIRIELGGTTIAVHSFAYDPEQPPGGCASVVPSRPGNGGSVFELFLPGLAALTLLWLEQAYRRRRAIDWRPLTAATTATVFVTVVVVPYPLSPLGSGTAQASPPAGVTFYHGDRLGSSIVISDSAGTYQEALYRPFGEAVLETGGSGFDDAPELGFTGQRYLTGANLYHFGARAYHPALGRFLQPDPLVADLFDPNNLNRYSYVLNDPLNMVDPTGLFARRPCGDGTPCGGGGMKRGGGGGGAGGGGGIRRAIHGGRPLVRPEGGIGGPGAPPTSPEAPPPPDCETDEYSVVIDRMPPGVSPNEYLMAMATDFNGTIDDWLFDTLNAFHRRSEGPPRPGEIIDIDFLGPENGSVMLTYVGLTSFIFTTVDTDLTGTHPIVGSREFGFEPVPGGTRFYTRGRHQPRYPWFGLVAPFLQSISWSRAMRGISDSIDGFGGGSRPNSFQVEIDRCR